MELKRIIARDSRAANDKAIQLYGPDVLVISSQRVDNQTELIVALDTNENVSPAPDSQPAAPAASRIPAQTGAQTPDGRTQARFQAFSEVFKVNIENPQAVPAGEDEDWEPAALRLATPPGNAVGAVANTLPSPPQVMQAAPLAPAFAAELADLQRSRETVELLRLEIAALRQEFNLNRQVAMWQSGQGLSPELTQWFARMQELGVPASLRTLMVDATGDCTTVSEAWPRIHQTLVTAIQRKKAAWPQKGVHALAGPSGAGKSLMVARMAMAASTRIPVDSMAIISLADTKAGAWSQLQVLAAQSGVSCYRAADVASLEVLLQDLSHHQVIWIDTPGTDFLSHARALQSLSSAVSVHAVLPLDATVTNVHKTFESTDVNWSSLILTKLDEAAHPWPALKALCDRPLVVSAVGSSHQPRTEPVAFDAQAIVDLAMQGLRPQDMAAVPPARKPRRRVPAAKTKALHG